MLHRLPLPELAAAVITGYAIPTQHQFGDVFSHRTPLALAGVVAVSINICGRRQHGQLSRRWKNTLIDRLILCVWPILTILQLLVVTSYAHSSLDSLAMQETMLTARPGRQAVHMTITKFEEAGGQVSSTHPPSARSVASWDVRQ